MHQDVNIKSEEFFMSFVCLFMFIYIYTTQVFPIIWPLKELFYTVHNHILYK